ncbi:DUF3306 domain-containing protein [Epibacterium sp. SM1969]|uniref:DUF3306 domain-containing protein n=1 Tax=Tritonibacter aquimaris TaxID=2663379 RepID=A0A844AND4_9RHOB|nr:DUF3306 domain-containing protein [Tritonibacter aquimaris]MQY44075.1 DUF3306 domain-containing protein [Tritonibacter aquimaris]
MSTFWARRKEAVEAEAKADEVATQQVEEELREQELHELSDEEILTKLDLPDPDTLGEGDNFKVFLNKAVPSRIRTRALRRLWRVNPVLANIDGLVDYGEDFTDAALVVEGMETAYQVGKGMRAHVEELARKALEQPASEDLATAEAAPEDPILDDTSDTPGTSGAAGEDVMDDKITTAEPATPAPADPFEEEALPVVMGRMRFQFDNAPVGDAPVS